MENLISYLRNYSSYVKTVRFLVVLVAAMALIIVCYAIGASYVFSAKKTSQIYVLDQGHSLIALQSEGAATRDLEVRDHVRQFHQFFFNLAPNDEVINANKEKALLLSDRSAYNYWNDLAETGYFTRLVQANVTQQIQDVKVDVNVGVYPFEVRTTAKIFTIRESLMTVSDFESSCLVILTERSESNPHGMMIEKFRVVRNELLETRNR